VENWDIVKFSREKFPRHKFRSYQAEVAEWLAELVQDGQGGKAAVVFSRQSGKDEVLAQLLAWLLVLHQEEGGSIVVALPTVQQANISKARLLARLEACITMGAKPQRSGYEVGYGQANVHFLTADPSANVRGETASLLLVANEAQDIKTDIWDARFDPMGASTNAPTLFLGTPWNSSSLLSREMKEARRQERLWLVDWRRVARDVPAYGKRVEERIAQFGPHHPFIRTEYECQELGGEGGLFPEARRQLMRGSHSRVLTPGQGQNPIMLLVDVAGSDETSLRNADRLGGRRDSSAVTVVEVDISPTGNNKGRMPTYRVINRYLWHNVPLSQQHERLTRLAEEWRAKYLVVDATGLGAGLVSNLKQSMGKRVIPFVFSLKSKSDLAWNWLGIIESGRYLEYAEDGALDTALFWRQLAAVESEVMAGPGQFMRWSVPDPALHDDLVMSAALVGTLEDLDWRPRRAVGEQT